MNTLPAASEMYQALVRRDRAYEGIFLVAVKTTGIFCKPTCPSKKPRRENVEFFPDARQCMLAGYRPCRRCRPTGPDRDAPPWVSTLLSAIERRPQRALKSADLRAMAIDPARVRRYFVKRYGMTFSAYHRARRIGLALHDVRAGRDLSSIGLRTGFQSTSGFRDAFGRMFGEPPGRSNGVSCLLARWLDTPLGAMLAIASDDGLCLLEFVDRRMLQTQIATLRRRLNAAVAPGENAHLRKIASELAAYFEGTLERFTVPLVLRGSPFQLKVWQRLMHIPYAATSSYSQMARDLGAPGASRAVGRANGDNRLAIIIPCHRVIRADGSLCGYGGGLWRKKWLLEHERAHTRSS